MDYASKSTVNNEVKLSMYFRHQHYFNRLKALFFR